MKRKSLLIVVLLLILFILMVTVTFLLEKDYSVDDSQARINETVKTSSTTGKTINVYTATKNSGSNPKTGQVIDDSQHFAKMATLRTKYTPVNDSAPKVDIKVKAPIHQKVYTIIYDTHELPCCTTYPYKYTPQVLNQLLAKTLVASSVENGYLAKNNIRRQNISIEIVGTKVYKAESPKLAGKTGSGSMDYNKIINELNLCQKLNNNEIDEVWIWADRTGGLWESIMAGPYNQIYFSNAYPLTRNDCNRAMYIMGFNYEVYYDANILQQKFKEPSVSMAMHSFSHRTESTLAMFWDGKYKDNVVPGETTFEFFGQTPTILNKGYAGNTHFTPNSNQDATYHIQDKKATNFLNWNPQHTNAKTVHGCEAWDCYEGDYFDMWFQNIPGRCTSAKMKKTDGTPMPNMWYAMFKNQYYYENTDCLHINQYFVRNGNLWNRNNKLGWSKWENLSLTKPYSSFGSGSITSASMFSHPNGFTDEYVVKGGAIWTRTTQFNNKWSDWENVTSNITVGSGTITSFVNTMHPNNYQLQYLTRGGEIWSRSNQFGWNNPGWLPATSNVSSVGSGVIKSFSQFTHSTGHIEQYLTRGELIWYRDNKNGWSSWANVTSNTNSVGGTGTINSFTSGLIKE